MSPSASAVRSPASTTGGPRRDVPRVSSRAVDLLTTSTLIHQRIANIYHSSYILPLLVRPAFDFSDTRQSPLSLYYDRPNFFPDSFAPLALSSTMTLPKVFANIDTGKITNNELLDATQPSAFEFLGLSKKQRLYGFLGCLVGGFVVSLIGSILFVFGSIVSFALLYILGILISLTGTGFLVGFTRQIKTMFKPVRVVATILFLGCVIMVFVAAFVIKSDVLVLVFAILTFFSYTWYSLSYIPYARALVSKAVGSAV